MAFDQYCKSTETSSKGKYVVSINGRSGVLELNIDDVKYLQDYLDTNIDHIKDKNNPHEVTAQQVGLAKVDNTSDINKPISTLQQKKFDELESKLIANVAGYVFYEKETTLLASRPTANQAAIALDTKKTWYWNGTKWTDIGLSELEAAKQFTTEEILNKKYNKGLTYPLFKGTNRGEIETREIIPHDFLTEVLVGVKVLGAKPNHLYRLGYYENGFDNKFGVIFEEISKTAWTSTGIARRLTTGQDVLSQLKIEYGTGIQTYLIRSMTDKTVTFTITIDTDIAKAYEGSPFAQVQKQNSGYCWYIDEQLYTYAKTPIDFKDLIVNSAGLTTQNRFNTSAEEDFSSMVNGGQLVKDAPQITPTLGSCIFQFPNQMSVNNMDVLFDAAAWWRYEVPLLSIPTFTTYSPLFQDLFTFASVNESGCTRFTYLYSKPMYVALNGTITVLKRIPVDQDMDKYNRNRCTLVMDILHNKPPQDNRENQFLAAATASFEGEPVKLIKEEFVSLDDDVLTAGTEGYWVRYVLSVNNYVYFTPDATYRFTLQFNKITGDYGYAEPKNTDIKIESGSLSFNFDAGPLIQERFKHKLIQESYRDY